MTRSARSPTKCSTRLQPGRNARWKSGGFYPILYLDAIVIKVRDGHQVRNKAAHMAIGVTVEGIKHVLGIWVTENEGAKFWTQVCAQLANRGVKDVLIACCDGLTGFPEAIEAIEATWARATVQTCVVHLIRSANRVCLLRGSSGGQRPVEEHLHGSEHRIRAEILG